GRRVRWRSGGRSSRRRISRRSDAAELAPSRGDGDQWPSGRRQRHCDFASVRLEDKLSPVGSAKLLVGVKEFNTVDRPIRRDIDIELVANANGFNFSALRPQAQIGDVAVPIIGQFHRLGPQKYLTRTVMTSQR